MAISSAPPRQLTGLELMAHLFRRAGFGATPDELDAALARGYEATVEELLNPERVPDIDEDLTQGAGKRMLGKGGRCHC